MKELNVSERLKRLVDWIPTGAALADIGSDHAYLPVYAYKVGKIVRAIAGEVNNGPYVSAKETVQAYGLHAVIEVRKGNGLKVIKNGEVDTIVIAGMGGALIRTILDEGYALLNRERPRLVLQPNNGEETLRAWLYEKGWVIHAESILEEDGHIYEALSAIWGSPKHEPTSQEDLMFGPFLRLERNPVFLKKWESELKKWERIYRDITSQAEKREGLEEKQSSIRTRMELIKEAIQ